MKKYFTIIISSMIFLSCSAFADVFSNLSDITEAQQEQLTQIHEKYKQANNELETKIMDYNSKIAKIRKETDKSASDIMLLTSAYQRNIELLKAQQEELAQQLNDSFKAVLTEEQYSQYELQKEYAKNAFSKFLQK